MRFRQGDIQLQSFGCQALGSPATLLRRNKSPQPENRERVGEPCVCRSVVRIFCNGLLEALDRLRVPFPAPAVPIVSSLQIGFVSLRVDSRLMCELCLFLRRQIDLNFMSNRLG